MPQKNPFGNVAGEDVSNWGGATLAKVAVLALEAPLHAVSAAGNPAAAPAPRIDWTNLRRVRRKLDSVSLCFRGLVRTRTAGENGRGLHGQAWVSREQILKEKRILLLIMLDA